VRKIISVLPQKKYASIITILHNMEDLSTMTLAIVIGKIVAFEMSRKMGQGEASLSSKGKPLACSEKKKMKGKRVETSSSSSSSSEDEEEEEDDDDDESSDDDQSSSSDLDEESIKLINKVEKMIQRLNVKGVAIQIQDFIFTNQRNEQRKNGRYGCGKLGHFMEVCRNIPTPKTKKKARKVKHQAVTTIKTWHDSSSEDEAQHKRLGHKHSSSSSSRVCLIERGNESSSSSDSDSDDEMPSLNELVQDNLKYAKACTSQQKKLKMLQEKLDSSQEAYKTLLEQYETYANLNIELCTKIEQLEVVQQQMNAQSMICNL
jgi:hypothetical protein